MDIFVSWLRFSIGSLTITKLRLNSTPEYLIQQVGTGIWKKYFPFGLKSDQKPQRLEQIDAHRGTGKLFLLPQYSSENTKH